MKTTLLISSLFLLIFQTGQSQTTVYHPFPDSDAIWNMSFMAGNCPPVQAKDYYSLIISGDTVIGAQTYHKLNLHGVQIVSASSYTIDPCKNTVPAYKGAIRQDINNKKVYIVPPSANSEQLLYDFTMQVSDTLKGYLASTHSSSQPDIVSSIDSVLVGNSYRKRWKINPYYSIDFIEGIGSTYGLVERSPANMMDWKTIGLACFKQNDITLYINTNLTSTCNLITTSVNSIEKNSTAIKISPNPFSTQTTLSVGIPSEQTEELFKDATLTVYNSFGQQVKQLTNISGQTIVLPREHLASGLYFIRLTQNNKIFSADKLVITDY